MPLVNIREAKANLALLIDRAGAGEEFIISRAGKPVVRLIAYQESKLSETNSRDLEGEGFEMSPDFDEIPDAFSRIVTSPRRA